MALSPCLRCGSDVHWHGEREDDGCTGCHVIRCSACRALYDMSDVVDPENTIESLAEMREKIEPEWNNRRAH